MSLGSGPSNTSYTPAISADQLPVLPGMSLGDHLQVLHHHSTGLLGVQLIALDQIDNRRVRAHLLVPLNTGNPADPDGRHTLSKAMAKVRRFEHPMIVRTLGFLTRRLVRTASFCIITERPEGHGLRRILTMRGGLPAEAAIRVVDRIASLLEAAHEHDILHLALSLDNITIDPQTLDLDEPTVSVLDLGLVQAMRMAAPRVALPLASRTSAPEVLQPGPVGPRADVYSLGALLRTLTTSAGTHPPTCLIELIQHATALHPESRPESIAAFRAHLAEAANALAEAEGDSTLSNKLDPPAVNDQALNPIHMPSPLALTPTAHSMGPQPGVGLDTMDVEPRVTLPPPQARASRRLAATSWLWILLAALPFAIGAIAIGAMASQGSFSRPTIEAPPSAPETPGMGGTVTPRELGD